MYIFLIQNPYRNCREESSPMKKEEKSIDIIYLLNEEYYASIVTTKVDKEDLSAVVTHM